VFEAVPFRFDDAPGEAGAKYRRVISASARSSPSLASAFGSGFGRQAICSALSARPALLGAGTNGLERDGHTGMSSNVTEIVNADVNAFRCPVPSPPR